ncbi:MAG TPA: hypothetical protein VGR21_11955 [Cryptosporangiaceae bacterium]|nr:hypothetical protein [Cryptosporangiaceae bacterium]
MEQQSNKHGPRMDEELQHETEGIVRSGHTTRTEEWRDPEPPGDDQPDVDLAPNSTLVGGVPDGLTPQGVAIRSELATYLGLSAYPIDKEGLRARLVEGNAPPRLVALAEFLPDDQTYANVGELSEALGLGAEDHRF